MSDDLDRVDCLRFPGDEADTVRLVPAGMGERVVATHHEAARRRSRLTVAAAVLVMLVTGAVAVAVLGPTVPAVVGTLLVGLVSLYTARRSSAGADAPAPTLVETDLPVELARERYEVTAASATPFDTGDGDAVGDVSA